MRRWAGDATSMQPKHSPCWQRLHPRVLGHVEATIARLAGRDDGVIARSSLLREAVASTAIDDRVRSGRLRPMHPGVYFAGHGEPSRLQAHRAAVVACGPDAVLGRASASEL